MRRAFVLFLVVSACGSAPTQVSFVSNEQPSSQGAPVDTPSREGAHHEHPNGGHGDLPNDEEVVEPGHPAADTKQERVLVHIHGPDGVVCSGVAIGPRAVATTQRCLKGESKGASAVASPREYKVEIPSSTLTWTTRMAKWAILPSCNEDQLDVGLLVFSDPAPWVEALRVVSAPGAGAKVEALGFGHCGSAASRGAIQKVARGGSVQSRDSDAVVIDVPLCRGDAGGPVVDGADGSLIGLISHRDDPRGSPLRTTTITRLDTTPARELLAQAKLLADSSDTSKVPTVACH